MAVVVEETITEADVRVVMAEAEVEAGQMVAQDKMIQQIFLALFKAMLVIKVLAVMVVAVVVVALQTELLIQRLLVMVAHRQIIIIQQAPISHIQVAVVEADMEAQAQAEELVQEAEAIMVAVRQ